MPNLSFVPEQLFIADSENRQAIDGIFKELRLDFPETGVPEELFFDDETITPGAMIWMWDRLMGRQHGNMEPGDGKLVIPMEKASSYWPHIRRLHYGPYSFTQQTPIDTETAYSRGLVLGGTPDGMAGLLQTIAGPHGGENIQDIFLMAGQRTRWDIETEASIEAIYDSLARETNVDVAELRRRSPFLRREERRLYADIWHQPFATEYELGRVAVEATFFDFLDWNEYPVSYTPASDELQQIDYRFRDEPYNVPNRQHAMATYQLKNGTRVHVLNGRAVNRPRGVPRPNSSSQTDEILSLVPNAGTEETVAISTSLPHVRAGLDIAIILAARLGSQLNDVAIATAPWLYQSNVITALGELPATHKADLRLRAALRGEDPDQPTLTSL